MNYQFTVYTVNRQVTARKSEEDEFTIIKFINLKGKIYSY